MEGVLTSMSPISFLAAESMWFEITVNTNMIAQVCVCVVCICVCVLCAYVCVCMCVYQYHH